MAKARKRKILLLPGDGIGPEVVRETKKIIEYILALLLVLTGIFILIK